MKFNEKWLREWIDFKIDSNILYDQISSSGIEIEYIKKFEPISNDIIIGKIVQCIFHPQSNQLKIVKVDIGNKKLLNIICGATNCRNGIKVAVATVGSNLPKNIKIDKKILRGETSEGMLCSYSEIGLFYSNKIIEFSQNAPIGMNVNDYLLLKDNIINVSVTSNRPDGLSILGISRSIAAINNFKTRPLEKKSISILSQKKIHIQIESKKECINYLGRIIENININAETPFWMKRKLFFSDITSENVIIDIINYVLIEIGQPLNVLDFDSINNFIIARMAFNEENILLKNNISIKLNKNILVFSDKNKILSLPGNINANSSDLNKNTKNIFLNSCLINKKSISYLLKKLKSNKMLEYCNYGIDSFLQTYAIDYATDLIIKICGGKAGPISKCGVNPLLHNKKIRMHHRKFNHIIGYSIDKTIISNILYNLGYQFFFLETYWDVLPPSWRFDILFEEDVVSDVLRVYGYNNIHLIPLKEPSNLVNNSELTDFLLKKFSIELINKGYYEVINYGFIDPKIQDLIFPNGKKILLSNPISQDMSCMRLSLWPGLLKTVSFNMNRQQQVIRLFESGLCFLKDEKENLGIRQEMFLSAIISGNYIQENWYSKTRKVDFYDLKGDLEFVLESIYNLNDIEFRHEIISGLHPEQSASIYFNNNFIGTIGAIDPRLEKKLNVNSSTFLFEILLNNFSEINNKPLKIQEVSKFPSSRRDLSILIPEYINFSDIINRCKKFFFNKKVEINLFDVYSCKDLSQKKKSFGISFVFQDVQKTLEENEITLMMNDCIGVLKKEFQVTLRK